MTQTKPLSRHLESLKFFFALCLLRAHEANGWKVFARSSLRDYGHKFYMHFASARLSAREPFNGLLSIKIVRVINKPIHVEMELIKQHVSDTRSGSLCNGAFLDVSRILKISQIISLPSDCWLIYSASTSLSLGA